MEALSPWLLNTNAALNQTDLSVVYQTRTGGYQLKIVNLENTLWLTISWPKDSRIAIRLTYSPDDRLNIAKLHRNGGTTYDLGGPI